MLAKTLLHAVLFAAIAWAVATAQDDAGAPEPNQADTADATAKDEANPDDAAAPEEKTSGKKKGKWRRPSDGAADDPEPANDAEGKRGRSREGIDARDGATSRDGAGGDDSLRDVRRGARRSLAKVTQGPGTLPNEAGQVWRDYDISPYTLRVTSTNRPEQAIVDWVLRETGYEVWHAEPIGLLSANLRTLSVYHTPEMQAIVADVVDRFLNRETESHAFGLRVVSVGNPNWRAKAISVLHPIEVETQGIQAWLLPKEDAALLLAELRKRTDFREHSAPHLLVSNGQATTVSATRARTYVRDIVLRRDVFPPFDVETAQFDEGFSLELSPLLSLDSRTIDAVIKCQIDQLERLVPVMLEVPSPVSARQRTKIDVPQVTHCRLNERFQWPIDQVLVVGLGVVATPVPVEPNPLLHLIPFTDSPARADLLVFVESKGQVLLPEDKAAEGGGRTARDRR